MECLFLLIIPIIIFTLVLAKSVSNIKLEKNNFKKNIPVTNKYNQVNLYPQVGCLIKEIPKLMILDLSSGAGKDDEGDLLSNNVLPHQRILTTENMFKKESLLSDLK